MEINHQAPLVVRKKIFIKASPEIVWKLLADINAWSQWQPGVSMARRCTGTFTDNDKTLTARHERSDDGVHWIPSMTVTLRKID
jgi:hypothetical protein